jgi:hypothetical protein
MVIVVPDATTEVGAVLIATAPVIVVAVADEVVPEATESVTVKLVDVTVATGCETTLYCVAVAPVTVTL